VKAGIWILPALAAFGAGGLLRSQYERDHFVVEETWIRSPKIKRGRTVVFLTDLHDKEFGEKNQRLLERIRQEQPDFVLIGGDTMVAKPGLAGLKATEHLIAGLRQICPVYYGNGNHEQRLYREQESYGKLYQEFCRLLIQYQVTYLSDASVEVDEDIRISGLNIAPVYYRDVFPGKMDPEYIARHLGRADKERFQILLSHSPLFLDAYAGWGADLTLAGHFHGGTVRIPGLGGVMTPQYQFFLPCCGGTFEKDRRTMIVGRGLGTHSINIRFCNKPQVVVVRLNKEVSQNG
jgi:predicted MPP superfamily phosphohydrolase